LNTRIAVRPFKVPTKFEIDTFGGTNTSKMNMINLDIQLNQFTFLLLDKGPDAGSPSLGQLLRSISEIGTSEQNYMILAVPYRL
jgi:hypothetical protein